MTKRRLGKISLNHRNIPASTKFVVNGYEIYFPFEAYEIQKAFIASMIKSLDNRSNGLFQSPTGTGKTLSLLTGALAFLHTKRESGKFEQTSIIYCSRTHSQVKQLVRELKKTCYKPKVCVLGSRDKLCVNEELDHISGSEKNLACKMKCHARDCDYNKNFAKESEKIMRTHENDIMDIEEIAAIGKSGNFCSYYFSRTMAHRADIIFAPYNYITNPQFRSILAGEIKDSIMIFDEAHNLDNFAEEGSSFTLSTEDLEKMEREFNAVKNCFKPHKPRDNPPCDAGVRAVCHRQASEALFPLENLKVNLEAETRSSWRDHKLNSLQDRYGGGGVLNTDLSGEYIFEFFTKKSAKLKDTKRFTVKEPGFTVKEPGFNWSFED
jgi:Rad3-related DNA helicase